MRIISPTGVLMVALCAEIAAAQHQLDVELVADGLVAPLDLVFAPDGSGRRFIVDQTGLVLVLTPDTARPRGRT